MFKRTTGSILVAVGLCLFSSLSFIHAELVPGGSISLVSEPPLSKDVYYGIGGIVSGQPAPVFWKTVE